jgi:hypothetical protein
MSKLINGVIAIAAVAAGPAGACAYSERNSSRLEVVMEGAQGGAGVARLPYARGKTFHSLDEYLAHLERQGAMDLPWWRQVAPGVYERVTHAMPGRAPERATRAELMRRFGFTH